jgi:CrcB protein
VDQPEHPPVDPDVPPDEVTTPPHAAVLVAVAAGGVLGALARYGAQRAWPAGRGDFPWTVLCVNLAGCALIGVLMVLVTERRPVSPLLRPLLGTGVLGGFTTFSTYSVDLQRLLADGRAAQAFGYGAGTLIGAVLAVAVTTAATRRLTR